MHIHIKISVVNPFGFFSEEWWRYNRNQRQTAEPGGEQGPGRGLGFALMVIADFINFIHKPPTLFSFRSMSREHPVTVETFQFLFRKISVAYAGS